MRLAMGMGEQGSEVESFLSDNCPPMGIYETLYAFMDSFGSFMGTEGTHPWSQGFPLTTPLDDFGGPSLPDSIEVTWEDRFYPCLLYTSPSPRDRQKSRMPSSA